MFPGHEVEHAVDVGYQQLANGELIARAATVPYAVMVTTDKNIRHEHHLERLPLSVVELRTHLTRFGDLQILKPYLEKALALAKDYRFVSVHADGSFETFGPFTAGDHASRVGE